MSLIVSIGRWGGIYYSGGYLPRICLGWIAFTFIPEDFDFWIDKVTKAHPANLTDTWHESSEEA